MENSEVHVNSLVQAGSQRLSSHQSSDAPRQASGRMKGTNGSLGHFTGRLGRPGEGGVIQSPNRSAA